MPTAIVPSTTKSLRDAADIMPVRRRFTPQEYLRMADTGILKPNEKTELICGEVHTMLPTGRPHWVRVADLTMRLSKLLPSSDWCVVSQSTIEFEDSMPEPDIVVLKGNGRLFLTREPKPEEVSLLIEVADSTLSFDRGRKLSLYAAAGIANYWIINIRDRQIEVYSTPHSESDSQPARFESQKLYRQNERVSHAFSNELNFSIEVNDLFEPQ